MVLQPWVFPSKNLKQCLWFKKKEGGPSYPFFNGDPPQFSLSYTDDWGCEIPSGTKWSAPGVSWFDVELFHHFMDKELVFNTEGGHTVGAGVVKEIALA
ncbi:MAG: hypothetical protein CM15mP87_02980 [Candidatus Neomarinimicrobiota bacterium]|nr:MAG: hypothetical protein CM15mP87_02980 [Candidatus Neomarinimicrobiota bacterium]